MNKSIYTIVILCAVISAFFLYPELQPADSANRAGTLTLNSPKTCPSSGCAPGQRLNLELVFPIQPAITGQNNTLVCFAARKDGTSGEDVLPWADYSTGWVSPTGLVSQQPYSSLDINGVCAANLPTNESLITAVAASIPNPLDEKLQLALRVNKTTNITGDVKAYVYELSANGTTWVQTNSLQATIPVSQPAQTVYVAGTTTQCGSFSPCFVNSGDDLLGGLGTGLKDANDAYTSPVKINILETYPIKSEAVVIDKTHNITGYSDSAITYTGAICSNVMLRMTNGAKIDHLNLSDGNCIDNSRNLIEVNSSSPVTIESNTLSNGNNAINIKDNSGEVLIQFNLISNNAGYAVLREAGTSPGIVKIIANNIYNNQYGVDVDCQSKGQADHNYWGPDTLPADATANCSVTAGKRLGAPISSAQTGVDASLVNVSSTKAAYFNSRLAVHHVSGNDYWLYIVNHGNGSDVNVPFLNTGAGPITSCGNFYDVFLAENQSASDLVLSLKYDLNNSCTSIIESSNYCGQTNAALLPLWWYDPATNKTDKWDKTGENPKGSGASGALGQATTCNMDTNELSVTIDSTGLPNIATDLNFTPLVVGIPLPLGVELTSFTGNFAVSRVDLRWITAFENSVSGFHILRAEAVNGTYTRISEKIPAIGNAYVGGIYNYSDLAIVLSKNYFYKLEVVNNQGIAIETYGPLSLVTATPTPTATATNTITPTFTNTPYRTNTPYVYKSPTRYIPSVTPTSRAVTSVYKSPTPFLTNPGANLTQTAGASSTSETPTLEPSIQFATKIVEDLIASMTAAANQTDGGGVDPNASLTLTSIAQTPTDDNTSPTQLIVITTKELNSSNRYDTISWWIIVSGALSAIAVLILAGWLLFKSHLS